MRLILITAVLVFWSGLAAAAFCPKSGEARSGLNKICYYNCIGGTVAITVPATSLCPLSING